MTISIPLSQAVDVDALRMAIYRAVRAAGDLSLATEVAACKGRDCAELLAEVDGLRPDFLIQWQER